MSDYEGLGVTVGTNMIEYLDPVEGTVWEGLGGEALLEEVCYVGGL